MASPARVYVLVLLLHLLHLLAVLHGLETGELALLDLAIAVVVETLEMVSQGRVGSRLLLADALVIVLVQLVEVQPSSALVRFIVTRGIALVKAPGLGGGSTRPRPNGQRPGERGNHYSCRPLRFHR